MGHDWHPAGGPGELFDVDAVDERMVRIAREHTARSHREKPLHFVGHPFQPKQGPCKLPAVEQHGFSFKRRRRPGDGSDEPGDRAKEASPHRNRPSSNRWAEAGFAAPQ